jgi:hypothetical protein
MNIHAAGRERFCHESNAAFSAPAYASAASAPSGTASAASRRAASRNSLWWS